MYTNNAYLNNSTIDRKDKSKELIITMCGTYKLYTKQNFLHGVRVADWISNYFLSHLEKPTSILTMIQMKPSFMLVIWYYTDLKNLKNMNIMQKIM